MERLNRLEFNSNSSWTCPAGVTKVILLGYGGGSGGNGGANGTGGAGGKGGDAGVATTMIPYLIDVVPNTTYTITIGAGGNGGAINTQGSNGSNTTFGALATFYGAASGIFVGSSNANASSGIYGYPIGTKFNGQYGALNMFPKGGTGQLPNYASYIGGELGFINTCGLMGGDYVNAYSAATTVGGIGGGGMSGTVRGPIAGYGRAGLAGLPGNNAAANSGAGGAGGGGGSSGSTSGGIGGNGGSGKLIVMWVE